MEIRQGVKASTFISAIFLLGLGTTFFTFFINDKGLFSALNIYTNKGV